MAKKFYYIRVKIVITLEDVRELEFRHFAFPLEDNYPSFIRRYNFSCPYICAVCGERGYLRFKRINDKDRLSPSLLKIFFCSKHSFVASNFIRNFFIIFFVLIGGFLFLSIQFPIFLILLWSFMPMYIFFGTVIYYIEKDNRFQEWVIDYLSIAYHSHKTKMAVVSVKNPVWIEEFQRLNMCKEIFPILDDFDEKKNEVKGFIKLIYLIILGMLIGIPILFMNIWFQFADPFILTFSYMGFIFGFLFFLMIYHLYSTPQLKKLREFAYFGVGIRFNGIFYEI